MKIIYYLVLMHSAGVLGPVGYKRNMLIELIEQDHAAFWPPHCFVFVVALSFHCWYRCILQAFAELRKGTR